MLTDAATASPPQRCGSANRSRYIHIYIVYTYKYATIMWHAMRQLAVHCAFLITFGLSGGKGGLKIDAKKMANFQ